MSTPSIGDGAFDVDHGIIEVEFLAPSRFHPGRALTIALIGGLVFVLLLFVVTMLWQQSDPVIVGVSVAVAILIFIVWVWRFIRRYESDRIEKLCQKYQDLETPNVVSEIVGDFDRSGDFPVTVPLVNVLARLQRFGSVVRRARPESRMAVRPFLAPFEPLVLDEADEATAALAGGLDKLPRSATDGSGPNFIVVSASDLWGLVRRALRFGGRSDVWVLPGSLLLWLIFCFVMGANVFALLPGITLLLLSVVGNQIAETDWLVSPGALVIRGGRWRSSSASLRRYIRSEAVLVVHQTGKRAWQVAVGDSESKYVRSCTSAEIDLLLRCWLSPLEPLPIDRYSDFAGSK